MVISALGVSSVSIAFADRQEARRSRPMDKMLQDDIEALKLYV